MLSRTLYSEASCATRPRTLTRVSNRLHRCTRRAISTTTHRSSRLLSSGKDSIFSSESGAWNQILNSLDENRPDYKPASRRQGITARETKVLTGMLDMIFDSNNKGDDKHSIPGEEEQIRKGKVDDFFGRLGRHSKRRKWMDDLDASVLDRKKEQIDYCNSDQELLDWAIREVFEESKQYEATARIAIADAAKKSTGLTNLPRLQPATYPYMVPILMRTFRDKYHDPHLALSIFNYAKSLSIVSYVFGCSTEAYNELVQTKWQCFRDLRGVYQSFNEMIVNGVPVDTRTRKWVETVRRDVLNQKERVDANEPGQNEAWQLLTKIEHLLSKNEVRYGSKAKWDQWKAEVMNDKQGEGDDKWSFDNWGEMFKNKQQSSYRRGTTRAVNAPVYNY